MGGASPARRQARRPVAAPQPMQPALPPPTAAERTAAAGRAWAPPLDVFDPTQNPNAPGAPRTLGSLPAAPPAVVTAEPPVGVPGGRGAGAPLDRSTSATGVPAAAATSPGRHRRPCPTRGNWPIGARFVATPFRGTRHGFSPVRPVPACCRRRRARNPSATGAMAAVAPPSNTPKDHYDLAYGYVLRKDYAFAEDAFQSFLKKYPSDRRAPDAQFWLGESLFQRQRYDAAAAAFLDVSTKHAATPRRRTRCCGSANRWRR